MAADKLISQKLTSAVVAEETDQSSTPYLEPSTLSRSSSLVGILQKPLQPFQAHPSSDPVWYSDCFQAEGRRILPIFTFVSIYSLPSRHSHPVFLQPSTPPRPSTFFLQPSSPSRPSSLLFNLPRLLQPFQVPGPGASDLIQC